MATIIDVVNAIQKFEGYFPPSAQRPTGSVSYRNNNPGNIRPPGEGLANGENEGYCTYATYTDGFLDCVRLIQNRKSEHPTWTLADFFESYAPAADGNSPAEYAGFVSGLVGAPATMTLSELN